MNFSGMARKLKKMAELPFSIKEIRQAIIEERYVITEHARAEAENDGLLFEDIRESVMTGEIIKTYPQDRPYPSCLIFGVNKNQDPIHSVRAYNESKRVAILITVYRPDKDG